MTYVTEEIAATLKSAREARGLSQRALGTLSGVPQGHISKIEGGGVDLRLSSLIALARVLDFEVVLVPRQALSAVRTVARAVEPAGSADRQGGAVASRALTQLQSRIDQALRARPDVPELAGMARQVRDLQSFTLDQAQIKLLRDTAKLLAAFNQGTADLEFIRDALAVLRSLRNTLAHGVTRIQMGVPARPAYSLDDGDDEVADG